MSEHDADDLTTLFSTREATIAGRAVTVRELTFPQSMALNARMAPVIEALLPHYGAEGDGIDSDTLMAALAAQPDVALELLTLSTGQPAEWLAALPEHEGMHLLLLCVAVHIPFFARRLEMRHQARAQIAALAAARELASCSPASSATGTTKPH